MIFQKKTKRSHGTDRVEFIQALDDILSIEPKDKVHLMNKRDRVEALRTRNKLLAMIRQSQKK